MRAETPREYLRWLAGAILVMLVALAGFLFAIDPYDRGHGLFPVAGTLEGGPRTGNLSRGRDLQFDAAVVGNSHGQILSPERLGSATGLSFVQLTVTGSGPRETFVMLDYFARMHGGGGRAVVVTADHDWCAGDDAMALIHPFPFWLYDSDPLTYAAGLFRARALRAAGKRLLLIAGLRKPARPQGYIDYDAEWPRVAGWQKVVPDMVRLGYWNASGAFPVIDRLASAIDALPSSLKVVIYVPPFYAPALPVPGSEDARAEHACIARFEAVAAARPRTAVVDARVDFPEAREEANFLDATHYLQPVAKVVEPRIVAALNAMN